MGFFNVLSITFLLQIDNLAYLFVVFEDARKELESEARAELDAEGMRTVQSAWLAFASFASLPTLVLGITFTTGRTDWAPVMYTVAWATATCEVRIAGRSWARALGTAALALLCFFVH